MFLKNSGLKKLKSQLTKILKKLWRRNLVKKILKDLCIIKRREYRKRQKLHGINQCRNPREKYSKEKLKRALRLSLLSKKECMNSKKAKCIHVSKKQGPK